MKRRPRFLSTSFLWALAALAAAAPAHAYIGPGAGFAFLSSFAVVFVTFLLAILSILIWPIRLVIRVIRRRGRSIAKTDVDRVVILGLDGLDPGLAKRWMDEGLLPNFSRLAERGSFRPLQSSWPSMSPVAWSSFATGNDASRHNVFDFLGRDAKNYLVDLSSVKITNPDRHIKIGKYRIPLGKPVIRLMQKSSTFWKVLGDHGIFSHILRVPITFPPVKFNGAVLSAMCVPDLKGTQGSFCFFTTDPSKVGKAISGERHLMERKGNEVRGFVPGPENSMTAGGGEMRVPWRAVIDDAKGEVHFHLPDQDFRLKVGSYSEWIRLTFKPGLGVKVRGMVRFRVQSLKPYVDIYLTPTNIDPESPAMPISQPLFYSVYLAKLFGPYATLGLAEDTWALNEKVIDEEAFLEQTWLIHEEREKQFFHALSRAKRGMVACVFDATDRIQHMFFRYMTDGHPANRGRDDVEKYRHTIRDLYVRMDELLGRTLAKCDDTRTVLLVMSDHGFTHFSRGMNLNTWLIENGYMALKNGDKTSGEWFQGVDWSKTRAYSFGLAGLYLNIKDREGQGIVEPKEAGALRREIADRMTGLMDEEKGIVAVNKAIPMEDLFDGPYKDNAPDVIVGFAKGYRQSWEAAVGQATESVFLDNVKNWSGDHCIDAREVPGVLFSSRRLAAADPAIMDVGPSVLDLFGIDTPRYMKGRSFYRARPEERDGGRSRRED
ncbi:MAG: alkaline phosphatase family protein [Candidatus Eisenbacteria bacterium]|nr:alkaline phosphatase family protein [Candidatus Eisenbacteria bacterium]